jgi:invasion protein IalB
VKSIFCFFLLLCALLITVGTLDVSRALAQAPEAGAPQQQTAPESNTAPSVTGNWQVSWTATNGDQRQVSMQIKQNGSKLSGTFQGERGSASLKGSLKGNQISLTVKLPRRRQLSLTGTVDGGKMSGTTEEGASWTATLQ